MAVHPRWYAGRSAATRGRARGMRRGQAKSGRLLDQRLAACSKVKMSASPRRAGIRGLETPRNRANEPNLHLSFIRVRRFSAPNGRGGGGFEQNEPNSARVWQARWCSFFHPAVRVRDTRPGWSAQLHEVVRGRAIDVGSLDSEGRGIIDPCRAGLAASILIGAGEGHFFVSLCCHGCLSELASRRRLQRPMPVLTFLLSFMTTMALVASIPRQAGAAGRRMTLYSERGPPARLPQLRRDPGD